jgi:hypothetical protein
VSDAAITELPLLDVDFVIKPFFVGVLLLDECTSASPEFLGPERVNGLIFWVWRSVPGKLFSARIKPAKQAIEPDTDREKKSVDAIREGRRWTEGDASSEGE